MSPSHTGLLLLAATAFAIPAVPAPAQQAAANAPALRMQNVELAAFIQDVARATGTTFIVDPRVQGTVNVSRDQSLSNEDLIGVLLAVLRSNGMVAVPAGTATYRVVPDDTAAQQPASPLGFATRVFPLQRIDARAAAETLKPLLGRGGVVMALPQGNQLLVADYADNLRRVLGLVEQIDRDSAGIDTVTLRNTSARELAATLSELYGIGGDKAGAPLSVLAVESSNSLLLRGNPGMVQKAAKLALDLDTRAERGGDVAVVRLQHASAEQLLPVLQQLIGQAPDATAAGAADNPAAALVATAGAGTPANTQVISPASGKRPVIVRYPGANSLIVHADPDTQRTLLDVIRQLDVRREQVLVEALVVEVSEGAAKQLGTQLLLAGTDGSIPLGLTQFSNGAPGMVSLAGSALAGSNGDDGEDSIADLARQAAAQSLLGLNGGLFGLAERHGDRVFGLIINAVKSDTGSNLLSTPSLLTLDNEEAHILVGQEVPVTTGEVLSTNNDNPFRTINRQDVGIQLTVRPQINSGGGITLTIKQEVSSVNGTVSSSSDELVLNKREIQTNVVVDDGAIVALGGLLDHSDQSRVDKIPLLGDIPGLGALFRNRSNSRSKTNLMVFLRPSIVRTAADAQRLTAQRYGYLRERQWQGDPAAAAELDAVVRDYLRINPPLQPPPAPAAGPPSRQ
ncbi:type II secretion system secretin GspD [Stenotrophomonas sp. MMGLT7]|uniref:type II secretion system secretin GspD n=1 Tax=Stenotrophomonas sp. MMGLT7 TaxID=2901227 RepID=UPI001E617B85|nr:type II secretion system secretin GspD [Stenotrophomonas sp. MMGLT7]MCD7098942.1 type II secretion system secretin GspD [Stenotrophomonas sp. MMGLT7]